MESQQSSIGLCRLCNRRPPLRVRLLLAVVQSIFSGERDYVGRCSYPFQRCMNAHQAATYDPRPPYGQIHNGDAV